MPPITFPPPIVPAMTELDALPLAQRSARYRVLAEYLSREDRARAFYGISIRLGISGRITATARAYVVDARYPFRRAVLRCVLVALGLSIPSWLHETPEATAANAVWQPAGDPDTMALGAHA